MNPNTDSDLHEYATEQMSLVGLYRLIVGGLLLAILITGVMIAQQTQERHQTYQEITRLKRELAKMQVEENRLLIEQQTFSATPQVARRAVDELGMHYPTKKEQLAHDTVGGLSGSTQEADAMGVQYEQR